MSLDYWEKQEQANFDGFVGIVQSLEPDIPVESAAFHHIHFPDDDHKGYSVLQMFLDKYLAINSDANINSLPPALNQLAGGIYSAASTLLAMPGADKAEVDRRLGMWFQQFDEIVINPANRKCSQQLKAVVETYRKQWNKNQYSPELAKLAVEQALHSITTK